MEDVPGEALSAHLASRELFQELLTAAANGGEAALQQARVEFTSNAENFKYCVDQNGDTLLHKAVQKDPGCLKYLLTDKAYVGCVDPNRPNSLGKTPLHLAVKFNLLPAVELLLAHGGDPEAMNKVGSTPMHTAASCGSVECMELLLSSRAKGEAEIKEAINMKDGNGNTVLHKCAYDGAELVAEVAVSKGATVDPVNLEGLTPLHVATKTNQIQFVRFLIAQSADVNMADQKGNTPLHFAASRCFQELFLLFLEHGANIKRANSEGNTPLHVAAQNFQPDHKEWEEFIFEILRKGGDINAKNQFGKVPMDFVGRNSYWLFEPERLEEKNLEIATKQAEEARSAESFEQRREQDLQERRRQREERERFVQKEEERRRQEELERRRSHAEEEQRVAEEEEQRRLQAEEEAKRRKRKKKRKPKD